MSSLELYWTHVPECRVEAFAIIPRFNVLKNILSCFQSSPISSATDTLSLQRPEEALYRRVVKAVGVATIKWTVCGFHLTLVLPLLSTVKVPRLFAGELHVIAPGNVAVSYRVDYFALLIEHLRPHV